MSLKKIKDYKNYALDENGNVYNIKRNKKLSPRINKDGYNNVYLYQDGKGTNYRVHRLVAEAFIPNPNNLKEVNHKDHNTLNNNVNNLEWCSRTYNNRYSRAIKIQQLTKENKLIKLWDCMRDVERELGIKHSCISNCCMGKQKTAGGYKWEYINKKGYDFNE